MKTLHLEGTPYAWNFGKFPQACRDLHVKPIHVLHVGGHLGQEVKHYRAAGVTRVTYMEPNPESAEALRQLGDDVTVVQAAAGPYAGEGLLALCGGDGAWDTIRVDIGQGAGVHEREGHITVDVMPIRDVQRGTDERWPYYGTPDVLVVDTQGTEVEALRSADLRAPELQLVIVETQSSGHPEAAHVDAVHSVMLGQGWTPVLAWNHEFADRPHATFADVFYLPVRERPR